MSKRTGVYLLVGLLGFAVSLVVLAPAGWAYTLLRPYLQGLVLEQIEGSVWRGRAAQGALGTVRFGPLSWQLRIWRLSLGRLEADVQAHLPQGELQGRVGAALFGGERYGAGVRGYLPAASAMVLLELPGSAYVDGRLLLDLARVAYGAGRLMALEGALDWRDGAVQGEGRIRLGDYRLVLHKTGERVLGTLSDQDGPLRARGELILEPDGRYRLDLTLTPTTADTEQLVPWLRTIAQPGTGKNLRIQYNGSLDLAGPATGGEEAP